LYETGAGRELKDLSKGVSRRDIRPAGISGRGGTLTKFGALL